MPDSHSPPQGLILGLAEIRDLLIHHPASVSPETLGPRLERLSLDFASLQTLDPVPASDELLEIKRLNSHIQILYRCAASYFNNIPSQASLYSPEGQWAHEVVSRVEAQG